MNQLTRTKQGDFDISESISLDDVEIDKLIPIKEALKEYEKMIVDDYIESKIRNGIIIDKKIENEYLLLLNKKEELLAIYQPYQKDLSKSKPYKVFGGNES